jgi:hypothetical protein
MYIIVKVKDDDDIDIIGMKEDIYMKLESVCDIEHIDVREVDE